MDPTQPPLSLQPLAVIDIGSNSICLLVLLPLADGGFHTIQKDKDVARLREHLGADGVLAVAGVDRAVAALQRFRLLIDRYAVPYRAVATASLRDASNRTAIVARFRDEAGIDVDVVDGDLEARLAHLGVLRGLGRLDGEVMCADVGGGSTELVLSHSGTVRATASVALGAVGITRDWLGSDPVQADAIERARAHISLSLAPMLVPFRAEAHLRGVATSGTAQRLARIALTAAGTTRDDVHGLRLDAAALDHVTGLLAAAPTQEERLRVPGMDPSRADILLGGALIFEGLTRGLGLGAWTVSMAGLRTGIAADLQARLSRGDLEVAGLTGLIVD